MLLMRLIPYLILIASLASCSRYNSGNVGNGNKPPVNPAVYDTKPQEPETIITENEPAPVDTIAALPETGDEFGVADSWMTTNEGTHLVVKIKRTGCYGTCPIYVGAIFSDGKAFYFGEQFVEDIGYFEGTVSLQQLNDLVKLSEQNNYGSLADEYPTDGRFISDLPTKTIYINNGTSKKTILDRGNAPAELEVIVGAIQTLLHSVDWKQIKN